MVKRERSIIESNAARFWDKYGYETNFHFDPPDFFYLEQKDPAGKEMRIFVDDEKEFAIFSMLLKFLHQTKGKVPVFPRAEFPRRAEARKSRNYSAITSAIRVGRSREPIGVNMGIGVESKIVQVDGKPWLEISMKGGGNPTQTIRLSRDTAFKIAHAIPRTLSPEFAQSHRLEFRNAATILRWMGRRRLINAPPGTRGKPTKASRRRKVMGR